MIDLHPQQLTSSTRRPFPSGTVTFLFTDVEGSVRHWEANARAMGEAIERHFTLLDEALAAYDGVHFKTIGDAVQAAFPTAVGAVLAAVAAQRAFLDEDWGDAGPLVVRMAIHTGPAAPRDGDYFAPALNRLARLLGSAAGGQMVISEASAALVRDQLPPDITLRDLGEHRLRDLHQPERIFQIDAIGLPTAFPPLRTADPPLHNLPSPSTSFIGRQREEAEIKSLLADPVMRLLTLTGPGGIGKTRLALQVAAGLQGAYTEGIWFVSLAQIASPALVVSAVADVLGVRERSDEPLTEVLFGYLRRKHLLLILDNFEHVVDAAPFVAELMAACPGVQILVTSRAPLRISGEHEFPVSALALPTGPASPRFDDILATEAVRLFVARAQAVRPDFTLTEENAPIVLAICRRLDGLPLAIELAAARIRLLSPQGILDRLDNQLSLLTGGARDLPQRQQTLRAAIAWSHDLLEHPDQALFRRLAVFAGGWTLAAAEAVAPAVDSSMEVLDGLASLHIHSLIEQSDGPSPSPADEPRFRMLQTIRDFASERLAASGEMEAMRDAHAAYYAQLARDAEPHLTAQTAVSWLNRLDADHDNLRTALAWLGERNDAAAAVRLAADLWRFWWLRGHVSEGRQHLAAALSVPGTVPEDLRAAAFDGAGVLAEAQSDYERATALHEEALALSRQTTHRAGIARALGNLGVVAVDRGDIERAETLLTESLALAREEGDDRLISTALNDLGLVAYHQGDLDRVEALFQESLALRRKLGGIPEIARSLNNLGGVAFERGEVDLACQLYTESLDLYRDVGDKWGEAGTLVGLALATHQRGDSSRAALMLEKSLALLREVGDHHTAALALLNLADIVRDIGYLEPAAAHYREALAEFLIADDREHIVDGLAGLADVQVKQGQFATAARLLGAAAGIAGEPLEGSVSFDPERFRADVAAVRAALSASAFTAAWSDGRRLTPEKAIAAASEGP